MLVSCGASRGSPFVRDFSFPCYFLVQLRHKQIWCILVIILAIVYIQKYLRVV